MSQERAGLKKAGVKTWLVWMNRFTRNVKKGGSWSSTRWTAAESTVKRGNFSKKRWQDTMRERYQDGKRTRSVEPHLTFPKVKKKNPAGQLVEMED